MKRIVRKGFSMIELLFVMTILAGLAAVAIPNMSSSTSGTIRTSLESDSKNALNQLISEYVTTESAESIFAARFKSLSDTDKDGKSDQVSVNGHDYAISEGTKMTVQATDYPAMCPTFSGGAERAPYSFSILSTNSKGGTVLIDPCWGSRPVYAAEAPEGIIISNEGRMNINGTWYPASVENSNDPVINF